jgi:predicted small lipoprotein YifL
MRLLAVIFAAFLIAGCGRKVVKQFDISAYAKAEEKLKAQKDIEENPPMAIEKPDTDTINENTVK